jgi:hypothetical protein
VKLGDTVFVVISEGDHRFVVEGVLRGIGVNARTGADSGFVAVAGFAPGPSSVLLPEVYSTFQDAFEALERKKNEKEVR